MKIYLAHNFAAREWLKPIISLLNKMGHEITSNWITDDSHVVTDNARQSAEVDLADIDKADALVLFTDQYGDKSGKGKFLELGYALGKNKKCYICGVDQTSSVFYSLPQIKAIRSVDEL